MKKIVGMSREELLALNPSDVNRLLSAEEVVYMATTLGAFWSYDYEAAKQGRVGLHAELKSKRHSDGFFVSRILLEPFNIRYIMADQIVMRLQGANVPQPDYVAGIPDGATELGNEVVWKLGSKQAIMEKRDGRITLISALKPGSSLLLIEDFCTRGTGFIEAVKAVLENNPTVQIIRYDPVIINRGGLENVSVEGVGDFKVLSVVERRIQDWEPGPQTCSLCAMGSKPIKPKQTEENWQLITGSQKAS